MVSKLIYLMVSLFLISTTLAEVPLETGTTSSSGLCGFVYDWGTEDEGQQYSTNYISASWAGFEPSTEDPNNKVTVYYDWAIISDDVATDTIRNAGGEEDPSIRCRSESGLSETPDVADWAAVDSTYANNYQLSLTPGQSYFVLLRVTTTTLQSTGKVSKSIIYTNGHAISIATETRYTRGKGKKEGGEGKKNGGKKRKTTAGRAGPPVIFLPTLFESSSSFEPVFFVNSSEISSFLNQFSSGLLGWQIALIILGCVFALILLLVLVFIVVGRTKSEDKYETNVHKNENVEKV